MRYLVLVLLLIGFSACVQDGGSRFTVEQYADALRGRDLRNVRIEANKRLSDDIKGRAVDVYVANQHFIMVEGPAARGGDTYAPAFTGYKDQGHKVIWNKNLLLVGEPTLQKEIFETFQALR